MGQFGAAKTDIAGGTTPEVLQQTIAAQWVNSSRNPVVGGGTVTTRGDLRYNFAAGVGLIKTAAGAKYVTWNAGMTALVTQPSTTRTDVIFVRANGQIDVAVEGTVNESTVCVLDKMVLDAGATQTSGRSRRAHNKAWALPYGGTLGFLAAYQEFRQGRVPVSETMWQGQFAVPTDRWVNFELQQGIHAELSQNATGTIRYAVELDNALISTVDMPAFPHRIASQHTMHAARVDAGVHTLRVRRAGQAGPPMFFFGGGAERLTPGFVGVIDMGVAE